MKRITWGGAWGDVLVSERPQDVAYKSGSCGLWSTVEDYVKFARLFLGDGAASAARGNSDDDDDKPAHGRAARSFQVAGSKAFGGGWLWF